MVKIQRRLYPKGGSFETTVPMPLLFELDLSKEYDVLFVYQAETQRWYLEFRPQSTEKSPPGTFKRKLYGRAGSYELTLPKTLLFQLDLAKKHDVLFIFEGKKWYIEFQERGGKK